MAVGIVAFTVACAPTGSGSEKGQRLDVEPAVISLEVASGSSHELTVMLANVTRREVAAKVGTTVPWLTLRTDARPTIAPNDRSTIELEARCPETSLVQHGWVTIDDTGVERAIPVRVHCVPAGEAAASDPDLLSWEPPVLERARVIRWSASDGSHIRLETDRDYLVVLPNRALEQGIVLDGGRNVVMVGGEVRIPHQGDEPTISARRGLAIVRSTGVVHVEGLLLHGEDISEGVQISAPDAIVQLQNVAVLGLRARDQQGFRDNHPDVIQTYGNVGELRVDRLTGSTDYQGLFLSADRNGPGHGPVDLRRVNITGAPTARYLLWVGVDEDSADVRLEDVWLGVPGRRYGALGRSVWPDENGAEPARAIVDHRTEVRTATWSDTMRPRIIGYVTQGEPPEGDFVRADDVGVGYRSPGYVGTRP